MSQRPFDPRNDPPVDPYLKSNGAEDHNGIAEYAASMTLGPPVFASQRAVPPSTVTANPGRDPQGFTDSRAGHQPLHHAGISQPGPRNGQRESTVASADQAGDIFDLYERERDSWQSGGHVNGSGGVGTTAMGQIKLSGIGEGPTPGATNGIATAALGAIDLEQPNFSNGHTYGQQAHVDHDLQEDLADPQSPSAESWTGPMAALASTSDPRSSMILNDGSDRQYRLSTPPITITPDTSPMPKSALHVDHRRLSSGNGTSEGERHSRYSTLSTNSTSTSASVSVNSSPTKLSTTTGVMNDTRKLSPMHQSLLNRGRISSGTSGTTGTGTSNSTNASQVSIAASSQYPGEDNDAFHVRSTYARLEAEGVHGDGWDPGVERTRGGPQMSNKRSTVFEASKEGNVGAAEREYLSNLDRYGFVHEPLRNRSETRLALIPTAPLLRIPKMPKTSPIPAGHKEAPPPGPAFGAMAEGPSPRAPDTPKHSNREAEMHKRKETERVDKWMAMMSVKKRDQGGNIAEWGWRKDAQGQKLLRRIYKGIPDRWRMAAWWTLAEDKMRESKGKARESRSAQQLSEDYQNHIDRPSSHDVQIDLDVPRTISGHTLFVTRYGSGQRNLFHVLHCFSLICDSCGYCQGMGPIAATLLCYFEPERTYALLVRLHDVYRMHTIFAPGFPGLLEAFYVQERLMEWLMPDVYKSFQRNMISSSAWGTKWFITLFVNTVPFSHQLRLWDVLWLEGRDAMIITSITILWSFKDLLSDKTATFESILSLLSSYFVAEDEDAFMRFMRKLLSQQDLRDRMDGWRAEWGRLLREGKSDQALL